MRRVLVITLQSAEAAHDAAWTPEREIVFRATMVELGVLGGLILVMVASIYLLRRGQGEGAAKGGRNANDSKEA